MERALEGTGIEFALVHVNRDSPLWIVDERRNNLRLPERGVVVELAERDWLLVTGAGRQGDRHPLRIALDDRSTFTDMNRIVEQVYGFTAVSWRTLTKSREPVTITYGRLLAHEVGKLTPYGLPADYFSGGLTEGPWFL